MAYRDLRAYLTRLEQEGELQRIREEVDWDLEIGAVTKRCNEIGAPAPLFENVKGYPAGFRVLGSPVGSSARKGRFYARLALAVGLPADASADALTEHFARVKDLQPITPKVVSTAPCKENIQVGQAVDLLKFPVPYLHPHDGGRYIGTWHVIVTKSPDGTWTNWGLYRLMVHDAKTMGGLVIPFQHIGMHYAKWEARNEPMPFAVAIGTEPLIPLIAGAAIEEGVNEAEVIGAFRGEPLELVRCETVDLEVPASAEIVIEGHIAPGERKDEGPFGEYTGYQARSGGPKPVYHVTAVTHRNDPILPAVCAGTPVEDHLCMTIITAADILHSLRKMSFPVKQVFVPPMSAVHLAVISVTPEGRGQARSIAEAVWATKSGGLVPKIMIVDQDVDATNMDQVLWAFSTRNHPGNGIHLVPNGSAFPLWPFLSAEEKLTLNTTKVVFDCTWPKERSEMEIPRNASFDDLWPQDVREKVRRKWSAYGFPTA